MMNILIDYFIESILKLFKNLVILKICFSLLKQIFDTLKIIMYF